MATLKELRRRIHSVDNIKQITKSMEMIAAARFQKAHAKAIHTSQFVLQLQQIVGRLIATNTEPNYPLFRPGKAERIAVIVIGTDRGLCGAYNNNIFSTVEAFLKDHSPNDVDLIVFGRKAIDHFKRKKWPVINAIPDWGGKIELPVVDTLSKFLIDKFLHGQYKSIWLIYTQHLTIFSRKVMTEQLLPITLVPEKNVLQNRDYIFEPDIEELLVKLLPHYILGEIHNILNQAYASELAARVCAMRAATKNAQDLKEKLVLERNKQRQTSITKEVLEIASAAEAL